MLFRRLVARALALAVLEVSAPSAASTINQNTSWTITGTGAGPTQRVVAYGDSIYAGYNGALFSVAKRAGPLVQGEYLALAANGPVEVVRRARSGARAADVYENKILAEKSYMQASHTRVVTFEMCGNDYLQARTAFAGQRGTCDFGPLEQALSQCTLYTERAMEAIHRYAPSAALKVVSNVYYPGFDADNVTTTCTDATTHQPVNRRARFLPYLVRSNWRTCDLARRKGFQCADTFAEFMAADDDSNGDGLIDRDAVRYQPGESEAAYVARLTGPLAPTLRDANTHQVDAGTSYDYLQSDNVHPTYFSPEIISLSLFTGTGSGSGPADFSDAQVEDGKNPEWNQWGHERLGWRLSTFLPTPARR
jgi:lysophospholipase L1-like esterase